MDGRTTGSMYVCMQEIHKPYFVILIRLRVTGLIITLLLSIMRVNGTLDRDRDGEGCTIATDQCTRENGYWTRGTERDS